MEKGSPATLVAAINEQRRIQGMFPDVTEDEIIRYFGPSLPKILERFFPEQDTKILAKLVGDLAVEYTPQMMQPREGALRVLNELYTRGHLNYVLSSADGYDVQRQASILGLSPYLHGVHTFLLNGNSSVGSVEEFKAGVMINTGLIGVQINYGVTPESLVLVGDTETDMRAAERAKKMIVSDSRFRDVRVHGVLFDPNLRNTRIKTEYRLRTLGDILYV